MRRFLLGSALAAVLTVGTHGMSFASTPAAPTSDFRVNITGTIQLNNDRELSNQAPNDDSGDDDNGGNGSNGSGDN